MKASLLISALFCLAHVLGATTEPAVGQSYQFAVPEDVSFESKAEHEFYTFRWGKAVETQLLMLYPHPVPSSDKMLKPMADMMVISFEDNMTAEEGMNLMASERESIKLGPFHGEQLSFTIEGPDGIAIEQYVFLLHDGERIWNAQLSGMGQGGVERAKAILSTAKPVTADEAERNPEETTNLPE